MSVITLPAATEKRLILLLAGIQFCHIVDFMVMMPLGPQLMRVLGIDTAGFGLLVSAYTLAAGAAGFASAFFIDRYDRRRLLLWLMAGFLLATLACGLAPDFHSLLVARLLAGAFGGILGTNVMAYVGDCIPEARRGSATGRVMAAFSLAAVAGVPLGLWLATLSNWRAPFLFITVTGLLLWLWGLRLLPAVPARDHGRIDIAGTLRAVLGVPNHWRAFALMAALMLAGFSVIPFLSPFMVHNVGLKEADLPLIYFCGGLATLFTAPLIGRLADRHGKARVLAVVGLLSLLPLAVVTRLPAVGLPLVLVVTTVFMVLISGRLIPAMALITSASVPALRGRFLSMNTALQQLAASAAAFLPTLVLAQAGDGKLLNFALVGNAAMGVTLLVVWLGFRVEVRS